MDERHNKSITEKTAMQHTWQAFPIINEFDPRRKKNERTTILSGWGGACRDERTAPWSSSVHACPIIKRQRENKGAGHTPTAPCMSWAQILLPPDLPQPKPWCLEFELGIIFLFYWSLITIRFPFLRGCWSTEGRPMQCIFYGSSHASLSFAGGVQLWQPILHGHAYAYAPAWLEEWIMACVQHSRFTTSLCHQGHPLNDEDTIVRLGCELAGHNGNKRFSLGRLAGDQQDVPILH